MFPASSAARPVAGDRPLPAPPLPIVDATSLFFDLDGTLIPIADRPDAVVVGPDLPSLLERIDRRFGGRVAIVSGRSIEQIDALLGPVTAGLAVAGSHGAEIRPAHGARATIECPEALGEVGRAFAGFAADDERLVLETKSLGVALHFRLCPERQEAAETLAARFAGEGGLVLQRGKMMVEVRAAGDKGSALRHLLATDAMRGTRPMMFGDDVTDEDGFVVAAELGGAGVLLGDPRPTAARYGLRDVAALHAWMADLADRCR